jgi:hypothetical protein
MMTAADKEIIRRQVSWVMAQFPPEVRPALLRSTVRRVINRRKTIDRAAQQAVEGTSP